MFLNALTIVLIVILILLTCIVGLVVLANAFASSEDISQRLEAYAQFPMDKPNQTRNRRRTQITRFRLRLNSMLSIFASEKLSLQLVSANWPITETEYFLIRFWMVLISFFLGWLLFQNPLPGVGIAIILFLLPGMLLNRAIHLRRTSFERQLVDVLVLVKGAVRAGYSFLQSLDVVVDEMDAPASDEFRRVRREVSLGIPLSQALNNLHTRMQNDDLYLVITAININSQVGGNLSTMLEAVTETIRERVRLFSEVRALTSQQRYSGYLLTSLPFLVAGALFILNPTYIGRLFEPGPILCAPIGAVIMVLIGNIIMRRLGNIKI